jgi:hypothetical protein
MWQLAFTIGVGISEITDSLTVSASSYYNLPPHETAFLPEFAIDKDDSTAWSSLGEGCGAKFYISLESPMKIDTICARSRDMVDDPAVPHTDDSVIESFDILLDDKLSTTCILPDWKSVHCCSVVSAEKASKITLAAKKCRESANGPNNTGFKTVRVFVEGDDEGSAEHVTIVGSENMAQGSMEHVLISGSHMESRHSDSNVLTGHRSRSLSSDESSVMGSNLDVSFSDRAVAIGHDLNVQNSDDSVAIGSNLIVREPSQVVLGQYNAPSDANFVVASGSSSQTRNLFEVNDDGTIRNAHIQSLEQRVAQLETQLTEALSSCQSPDCSNIRTAFVTSGCCRRK